jgi:6-phosphogluconolactonase
MAVRTNTAEGPAEAADSCASFIVACLERTLAGEDRANVALSGGAGSRILFERLAATPFPWAKVHFFWVDERVVPASDERSNYRIAAESFLIPARVPGENIHRIHGELMPEAAARQYSGDVREFFGLAQGELPAFDVMHLGLGENVHTASLFPGSPLLEDREGIASAAKVDADPPQRVTLLPGVIERARQIAMFVTGASKAEAVRAVFNEPFNPARYPAQLTRNAPSVAWFLDRNAAGRLPET